MNDRVKPRPWRTLAFWAFCLSGVSTVIAGLAATFTGFQYRDSHRALFVTPHVDFETEDDPDYPPMGLAIENEGPGPAVIKTLTLYVDRVAMKDTDEALEYGKINSDVVDYFTLDPGDTMALGEKDWLLRYVKPPRKKIKQKDIDDFAEFLDEHVTVYVEYCSVMGNCTSRCSINGRCQ
jgi:hypothetical protein